MREKRRLIYQINATRQAMMKSLDAGCKDALGISVVQLTALMALQEREGCLMKELADILLLDNSAVTGLAKRMQTNGLVTKSTCAQDARAYRLFMTAKGSSVLQEGLVLLAGVNESMNAGFSTEELDTVCRYLRHVTQTFSSRS